MPSVKRGRANAQLSTEIFYTLAAIVRLDRLNNQALREFTLPLNTSNLINYYMSDF